MGFSGFFFFVCFYFLLFLGGKRGKVWRMEKLVKSD